MRRLAITAIACLVVTLLLFLTFKLVLGSGVSDVRAIAIAGAGPMRAESFFNAETQRRREKRYKRPFPGTFTAAA